MKNQEIFLHIICASGGASYENQILRAWGRNLIGARVTETRLARGMKQVELLTKLPLVGIDMSAPALSLLEGQKPLPYHADFRP